MLTNYNWIEWVMTIIKNISKETVRCTLAYESWLSAVFLSIQEGLLGSSCEIKPTQDLFFLQATI